MNVLPPLFHRLRRRIPAVTTGLLLTVLSAGFFTASAREIDRVLFLGNSITSHAPAPGLNWKGDWGMAASSRQNDFVHQAYRLIAARQGFKPELYISGRHTRVAGKITLALEALDEIRAIAPDLIVVQLGENERSSEAEFLADYRKLLAGLKNLDSKPVIACVGTWHPRKRTDPVRWDADGAMESKDMAIKQAAKESGAIFIGTSPIGHDERNSSKDQKQYPPGVQWHPGDSGMKLYGETIFEKLKPVITPAADRSAPSARQATGIVPEVKEFIPNGSRGMTVGDSPVLLVDADRDPLIDRGVELLREDFRKLYGIELKVDYRVFHRGGNAFFLTNSTENADAPLSQYKESARKLPLRNQEGYLLVSGPEGVFAEGLTPAGTLYAVQTLRQMLGLNREIVPGMIADYPDQELRVVSFGHPSDPEWIVRTMARLKVNLCIIESRWNWENNWWYNPSEENSRAAAEFIALCRSYGVDVAPLVQGLGWAYGVIGKNPHCAEGVEVKGAKITASAGPVAFPHRNLLVTESAPVVIRSADGKLTYEPGKDYEIVAGVTARPFRDGNAPWMLKLSPGSRIVSGQEILADYNYMNRSPLQTPYCPSEPETYKIVDAVLADVVARYNPRYIHIGHDEVIYQGRDSRCLRTGKSKEQLMGEDIRHWCDQIKSLNPDTRIMMWEDLVRPGKSGEEVLRYVPEDVIICPWEYRSTPDARGWVAKLLDWFLVKQQRPVLGAVSNYFLENNLDWKAAGERYRGNPRNLGFMYTDWGREPSLWGKLGFSADLMWADGPAPDSAAEIAATTFFRRNYGVELNLGTDFPRQMEDLAALVNRSLRAGHGVTGFAEAAEKFIAELEQTRYPVFARTDLAVGTFPENTLTQLKRFSTLVRCMELYGAALAGEKGRAETVFEQLKTVWPARAGEFEAWRKEKALPPSKALFGVDLVPLSPIRLDGTVWPVGGESAKAAGEKETVYDFRRELKLCMVSLDDPERYRVSVSADGRNFTGIETAVTGGSLAWKPVAVRYLKLSGPPAVKIRAYAVKSGDKVDSRRLTGDWEKRESWTGIPRLGDFTTMFGTIENNPATVAMAHDDRQLYFNFRLPVSSQTGHQVQVALNLNPADVAFFEVTVGQDGKISASRHGYESSVNKNLKAVNRMDGGEWECTFAVPLDWMGMSAGDLSRAAVNFLVKLPENREFSSWSQQPPPVKYWHNRQPTAGIAAGN